MRLTKLDFIGRIGDAAFSFLLVAAKSSVEIEKFVKLIDWATPDPDGTSIDTNDPRVQAIRGLEPMLLAQGKVSAGWADFVLADEPAEAPSVPIPMFIATHTVQSFGPATLDSEGTVRFEDGRWTTLAALAAMNKTVVAI